MRRIAYLLGAIVLLAAGVVAGVAAAGGNYPHYPTTSNGGGHTPVTICHKPGTPAEQTLVVDDDAVPGHLGHGDYLGECQSETTPTDTTPTTPTDTTPTTPTETTPTQTTPTTPPPHVVTGSADVFCDLPSQTYHVTGTIDGNAADSVTPGTIPGTYHGWTNVTVHRGDTDFRTAVFTYGDCHAATGTNVPSLSTSTPNTNTTPAATTPSAATTPASTQKPAAKAKPKAPARKPAATPKPKPPASKPPTEHVCKTLADGTKRAWYEGGNGMPAGCYPIIQGSG